MTGETAPPAYPIVTDPRVLAQVSRETSRKEIDATGIAEIMRLAMARAWTDSVGLAAIQVGVPIRFAIWRPKGKPETWLVNPEIVEASESIQFHGEGCLSVPGRWFQTWRYGRIKFLNDVDGRGRKEVFELTGLEAFIVQHEIDHMDGILCGARLKKPTDPGPNESCPCGSGRKWKRCCRP